jgi:subtilisin family serine protease
MKTQTISSLALMLLLAGSSSPVVAQSQRADSFAPDHILVRFKPGAAEIVRATPAIDRVSTLASRLGLPAGAALRESVMAGILRRRARESSGAGPDEPALDRFLYLQLPPGMTVAECVRRLEKHPLLEYAEPDYIGTAADTIPNDPEFAAQWHHVNPDKPAASIQTPRAWEITRGSAEVIVAVLDSGLGPDLPEFAGRTLPGYNFVSANSDTADDNGHGTAVAGVLCANANNGVLGAGVDWHCRVMPVKVLDSTNMGLYSWWADGIDFAVRHGCKVINLSAGGSNFDRTLQTAINNAIARGVIFVSVAGNDGAGALNYPGFLTLCITVGATGLDDHRAAFSNFGPQLDLVAPGVGVRTVGLTGELAVRMGTSFAAPMVSGVCALLAATNPAMTQSEARQILCAGAEDQIGGESDVPGFDPYHGWGRLNAWHALLLATSHVDQVRKVQGRLELSWLSPPNAAAKEPWLVECAGSPAGPWAPVPNDSAIRYETGRTYWLEGASFAAENPLRRFYRVRIRSF